MSSCVRSRRHQDAVELKEYMDKHGVGKRDTPLKFSFLSTHVWRDTKFAQTFLWCHWWLRSWSVVKSRGQVVSGFVLLNKSTERIECIQWNVKHYFERYISSKLIFLWRIVRYRTTRFKLVNESTMAIEVHNAIEAAVQVSPAAHYYSMQLSTVKRAHLVQ